MFSGMKLPASLSDLKSKAQAATGVTSLAGLKSKAQAATGVTSLAGLKAKAQAVAPAVTGMAGIKKAQAAAPVSTFASLKAKAQAAIPTKMPTLGSLKTAASSVTSAAKSVVSKATGAVKATKTAAENAAVSVAASQVPGGTAAVQMAKSFGVPSATILGAAVAAPSILDKVKAFFGTLDTKTMLILGGLAAIFILLLVGIILFFTQKKSSNFQNVKDTSIIQGATIKDAAASIGAQVKGLGATLTKSIKGLINKEGFAVKERTDTDDLKLINLQPLTIKQAGFIGPLDAGVFQEATAVSNTLKAGVRTFFFQIDYHEDANKDPKLFPGVKEPCLLYRDDKGVLISTNAGSILKMSQAIADIGFSNSVPSQNDPIVIVLYGIRVPADPVTDPKGYLAYCTKIATQLKPLAPLHLGMTANGDYHRQALQGQLFTSPFKNFENKVIILSNFDTSLYRTVSKMGIPPYAPADDLDYWTHAQIFKDDPGVTIGPNLGVTAVAPPNIHPRAKIYSLDSIRAVIKGGDSAISAWANKNKNVFTLVVPSSMMNPTYEEISTMVQKMGVNVLPFDFFSFDLSDTKRRIQIWNSATWNMRLPALRPTK